MSEYDFILDDMKFSHSSVNGFETCPKMFYLSYIDREPRVPNFFSDFGLFCHEILEKYFSGELELWDLEEYFDDNFGEKVATPPPPYPKGMKDTYEQNGLDFFSNFDFDLSAYDVISIEEMIDAEIDGVNLVIKPDLVLKEKETGKCTLVDYKTSKLKLNKYDEKKIAGYMRQFYLYVYFLNKSKNYNITKIKVWFIRNEGYVLDVDVDPIEMQKTIDWFTGTIAKIKEEKEWEGNTDKSNKYFCEMLCGVRNSCDAYE